MRQIIYEIRFLVVILKGAATPFIPSLSFNLKYELALSHALTRSFPAKEGHTPVRADLASKMGSQPWTWVKVLSGSPACLNLFVTLNLWYLFASSSEIWIHDIVHVPKLKSLPAPQIVFVITSLTFCNYIFFISCFNYLDLKFFSWTLDLTSLT